MADETLKLKGHVTYRMFNRRGELVKKWELKNLVVTVGKDYLASWLAAASQSDMFMSYVAVGSGTTPATLGDTALESELARVQGSLDSDTNVWVNIASFGPGVGTGTWGEAGLFSASSVGTMFARQVFTPVAKAAGNTIEVTWQVTLS